MRIYNWSQPGAQWPATGIKIGPIYLSSQNSNAVWVETTFTPYSDGMANNGALISGCCTARSDVLVRVQRDATNAQYTFEICDTAGANCKTSTTAITSWSSPSWEGMPLSLNGPAYSIGFLRWYSSLVPVGTPILLYGTNGDVADWEFSGNLTDTVHGLTFSGGTVSYSMPPIYPPSCNAGASQAFRAGFPARLDGSASQALDGGNVLTYSWQQLSDTSPGPVTWDTPPSGSMPQVSGLTFGSYNFQLSVTDSSGQSATCTVHHGAVVTDDNGIVITNNSAVDTLLGPMPRLGQNPWPWMEDRNKYLASVQAANIDLYYTPYWDQAAPGSVSVQAGTLTVTGTNTRFTQDFCGKNGDKTLPLDNTYIVLWWNGGKNRRMTNITGCTDDTHLTLAGAVYKGQGTVVLTETGLTYSVVNGSTSVFTWQFGGNAQYPGNYYDNVAAFYALYYRSGIDTYLTYARKLADRFWQSPMLDQGASATPWPQNSGYQYPGRAISPIGLVLRALDPGDPHPEMWSGLHNIWYTYANSFVSFSGWGYPGFYDTREQGYQILAVALCAIYDTDDAIRRGCVSNLQAWLPGLLQMGTTSGYSWPQWLSSGIASTGSTANTGGNASYVTLQNGSSAVTLNGSTWTPDNFAKGSGGTGTQGWFFDCAGGFKNSCTAPRDNTGGDSNWYYLSYVDSTHAALTDFNGRSVPYTGCRDENACDRGYIVQSGSASSTMALGWESQPFMVGIVGSGLYLASTALNSAGDTNGASEYLSLALNTAGWLKKYAFRVSTQGQYYFVGSVNCPTGAIPETATWCLASATDGPNNPEASRVLNAEVVRALMFPWYAGAVRDPEMGAFIDTLINAQWAKPGTCGNDPVCSVSGAGGYYLQSYDTGGVWSTGIPPGNANPKWFGMPFGLNPQFSWAAMRTNGRQQKDPRRKHD